MQVRAPIAVAPPMRIRLAVAVGTEHTQVFKTIIVAYAIDVVYLHGERLSQPLAKPAFLATILQQPSPKQASFNVGPGFRRR